MAFGDNVQSFKLAEPGVWAPGTQNPKMRRVTVPEVDQPWWWSEYLLDEWKRRNHYKQKPRDGRTGLQKSEDDWKRLRWRWEAEDPHTVAMPKHSIWDVPQ